MDIELREKLLPDFHEPALPDCRQHLLFGQRFGMPGHTESFDSGGNGSGGAYDEFVSFLVERGALPNDLKHPSMVEPPGSSGKHACSYFDDDSPCHGAGCCRKVRATRSYISRRIAIIVRKD